MTSGAGGMTPGADGMTSEEDPMTTAELAERAGTTKRTIRYYLAEGLLPPAGGTSARLEFQRDHEVRLRLIQHLQAAGIKLAAVKGILARYSLEEMESLVEAFDRGEHPSIGEGTAPPKPFVASVREIPLSLVYGTVREPRPAPPAPPGAGGLLHGDDMYPAPGDPTKAEASFPSTPEVPGGLWHRIPVAEEVEMLVRAPLDPTRRKAVEDILAFGLQRLAPREYGSGTSPAFSSAPAHPAPGGDPVGQPTTPEAQEEAP